MATDRAQNLQDTFLNHVRKNKTPLTIFLVNGVKLQGIVTWFDNFCVLLRRDGHSQLVYKHAISTIMPGAPDPAVRGWRGRTRLSSIESPDWNPDDMKGRIDRPRPTQGKPTGRAIVIGPYLRRARGDAEHAAGRRRARSRRAAG